MPDNPPTRLVRCTRVMTITNVFTIEIPAGVSNGDVEDALNDHANIFDLIDASTGEYTAVDSNTDETFDVGDTATQERIHFAAVNERLRQALIDDELITDHC